MWVGGQLQALAALPSGEGHGTCYIGR